VRGATCLVLCSVGFCCLASVWCVSVPCGKGVRPPFIDQGERANHMRVALFSYVRERDVLCCRVGGRPGDPRSDLAIMAYLVPEQWRPRG
jgi:hypothetical protein